MSITAAARRKKEARRQQIEAKEAARKRRLPPPPASEARTIDDVFDEQRAKEFARELESSNVEGRTSNEADELATRWQESPSGAIVALPIDELARHPDNRQPAEQDIVAKMASLQEVGQLEPIVVWQPDVEANPDWVDRYQILSGETRALAAGRLGWPTIQARIVTGIDAAEALQLLARYNGERKDLDPIQRARLGRRLTAPIGEGGGGLTQQQAAEQLGLERGASLANVMKLLELPPKWQDRVASGELAWSWAREMIPAIEIPAVAEALEEEWNGEREDDYNAFQSRVNLVDAIDQTLYQATRRMDKARWYTYATKELLPLFAWEGEAHEAVRQQLGIVWMDMADGGRGKTKRVAIATNVEAFDRLQKEAWHAKQAKKTKAAAAKAGEDSPANSPRKLSASEAKRAAEAKAEQFAARVAAWRHDWLKELVAAKFEDQDWVCTKFLLWILAQTGNWRLRVRECLEGALAAAGAQSQGHYDDTWGAIDSLKLYSFSPPAMRDYRTCQRNFQLDEVLRDFCQSVLLQEDKDPKHPLVPHEVVDALARDYGVDLDHEWTTLHASGQVPARAEALYLLFQSDQLDELGQELGVYLGMDKTKAAKVKRLVSSSTILKLPKCVKRVDKPRPRASGETPAAAKAEKPKRGAKAKR
jgi:ParB/RepB/Spo0J family partition protein